MNGAVPCVTLSRDSRKLLMNVPVREKVKRGLFSVIIIIIIVVVQHHAVCSEVFCCMTGGTLKGCNGVFCQRTAEKVEHSPTDLVESKKNVGAK